MKIAINEFGDDKPKRREIGYLCIKSSRGRVKKYQGNKVLQSWVEEDLITAIDSCDMPEEEKEKAKSLLK